MSGLAHCRANELEERPEGRLWLIEQLWAEQGVGIVGGEPKCCKSLLALDIAVSVASGAPALRKFLPAQTGRVLLFAAEDAPHIVRRRLEGIACAAGVAFAALDIHAITTPTVRLDLGEDQRRLQETVEALRPKLLVLDPFVRLHRIDENVAAEVAPVLGYLRELQRRFEMAVLLVHHARKGAAHARAGQALRGSSEIHAWGDSNLYLRRTGSTLRLTIEQRAAPSTEGLAVELRACGEALALHLVEGDTAYGFAQKSPAPSALQRVEQALAAALLPLTRTQLRDACQMRTSNLGEALDALITQGRVLKSAGGYQLVGS